MNFKLEVIIIPVFDVDRAKLMKQIGTVSHTSDGRYDRRADDVERVTGRPGMSVRESVLVHADLFGGRRARGFLSASS